MAQPETLLRRGLVALVGVALAATTAVAVAGADTVIGAAGRLVNDDSTLLPGQQAAAPEPPRPPGDADTGGALATTPAADTAQSALVAAEDDRLSRVTSGHMSSKTPWLLPAGPRSPATTVLTARRVPYDLGSLERLGAAEQAPDGSWLLVHSVVVARGAELRIQDPGGTLRMTSGPDGFTSIIAFKGTVTLAGDPTAPLTITSWNPATQAPDTDPSDGRAYIRAVGSRMDLSRTSLADLGFWSGRTGGLAWTGNSDTTSTGSLAESLVRGGHFGVFTSRATDVALSDSTLEGSELDGLLVHHATTGLTARNVTSTANGRDGFALVSGAQRITLTASTASRNAGDGIRIDGTPRPGPTPADALTGPVSPVGAIPGAAIPGPATADPQVAVPAPAAGLPPAPATARGTGFTVERSSVVGNADGGILVQSADGVVLSDNTVAGSMDGIVVRGPSTAPQITGNTVDATAFAIAVRYGVTGAQLHDNTVRSSTVGLHVIDSVANLGTNTVTASRYGVSLVGNVDGSSVVANHVGGRGLAAVDTHRVAPAAVADVASNDEDGWVTDRDEIRYWTNYAEDHPLLLLWLLILLVPFAARIWAKRRRKRHAAEENREQPEVPVEPAPAGEDSGPVLQVPLHVLHDVGAGPEATADEPDDTSATTLLPVTRVTVVSGRGAAP
ncbi:MAG: hypothetical protein QOF00_2011 [Pseudonocardiales bacterium]|nr:hypothetical protein [Pseudonocardiales bacterium]